LFCNIIEVINGNNSGVPMSWGVLILLALTALSAVSFGATIHVPSQQPTIQAGIDAAQNGDTVLVRQGVYYEHLSITKPLWMISQSGSDSTTIDGQNLIQDTTNSVVSIIDADSVNVEGFTICGGRGMMSADSTGSRGGGIYVENTDLKLNACFFVNNIVGPIEASELRGNGIGGGAVFADANSSICAARCEFRRNSLSNDPYGFTIGAMRRAGGAVLSLSDANEFYHCVFDSNSARSEQSTFGGAVALYGSFNVIDSCMFTANTVEGSSPMWQKPDSACGGALFVLGSGAVISHSVFKLNQVHSMMLAFLAGGGVCVIGHGDTVQFLQIESNRITEGAYGKSLGGGLYLDVTNGLAEKIEATSNLCERYAGKGTVTCAGGALYWTGSGTLRNASFSKNLCYAWSGPHPLIAFGEAFGGAVATRGPVLVEFVTSSENSCVAYGDIATSAGGGFWVTDGGSVNLSIGARDSIDAQSFLTSPVMQGGGFFLDSASNIYNCDSWSNTPDNVYGGDWTPGVNGNFSADPQFCYPDTGNFYLMASSPCAAGNHESGQTVGAFDVGCYGADMIKSVGLTDGGSLNNITNQYPTFSWLAYYYPSYLQTMFEIAVGTDNEWTVAEKWNPAPFNSSDTFVTYAGGPLVDGQTYFLRLRISDGSSWSNWYYTFFHMNTPPAAPVPSWPTMATTVTNSPTLSVENAFDAEADTLKYDFEIYYDSMLTNLAESAMNVPETYNPDTTYWTVSPPLDDNKFYYWHARAFDGYEYSPWSGMRMFIANSFNEPPTAPVLLSPPDSTSLPVFNRKPMLTWVHSTDPDPMDWTRYRVELSTDSLFTFKWQNDSLWSNWAFPPDSLPYGSHYWWRVTAFDRFGAAVPGNVTRDFWIWQLGDVDHSTIPISPI
jgi:hypothetical protein